MIKVFYYYYYLFYQKILKDDEPHLLTTLALSFSISLLVNGVLNITFALLAKFAMGKLMMLGNLALILLLMYVFLHRTGKAREIIKDKPTFFRNHKISIFLTRL